VLGKSAWKGLQVDRIEEFASRVTKSALTGTAWRQARRGTHAERTVVEIEILREREQDGPPRQDSQ
jgi:hypothetical protein